MFSGSVPSLLCEYVSQFLIIFITQDNRTTAYVQEVQFYIVSRYIRMDKTSLTVSTYIILSCHWTRYKCTLIAGFNINIKLNFGAMMSLLPVFFIFFITFFMIR